MKKVTKIILGSVAAVTLVVGASGYAVAKHFGGGHGMMGDYMIYKLDRQLDLTDTQVDQLEAIQEYVKTKRAEHKKEDHKAEIKALLADPVLDQQKIISMMDEKIQDMRGNAPEMISKIAAFTDSLSAEQRTALVEMMDKMGHRGHHRGRYMEQDN
jgi:Spy/CpxP family protein refolding chaperone